MNIINNLFKVQILIVSDDNQINDAIKSLQSSGNYIFIFYFCDEVSSIVNIIEAHRIDIIIFLDKFFDEDFTKLIEPQRKPSFIMLSKDLDYDFLGFAIKKGIDDYMVIDKQYNFIKLIPHKVISEFTKQNAQYIDNMYNSIFSNSKDLIFVFDTNKYDDISGINCLDINQTALDKLGYSFDTASQLKLKDILTSQSLSNINKLNKSLFKDNNLSTEQVIRDADGNEVYVEIDLHLINYKYEQFIVLIARDISLKNSAIRRLEKSKALLDNIFSTTHLSIAFIDKDFVILKVNDVFAESLMSTAEKLISSSLFNYFDERVYKYHFDKVISGNVSFKTFIYTEVDKYSKNEKYWNYNITPVYDRKEKLAGIILIGLDITTRFQMEYALSHSEERYRTLAETADDFIILSDINGTISYMNQASLYVLGLDETCFYNISVHDIVPKRFHKLVDKYLELRRKGNQKINVYEMDIDINNGKTISIENKATPIIRNGQVVEILIVARDITPRRKMESLLHQSEENFKLLAENIQGVFWLTNENGIVYVSPGYELIWGRSCESLYENPLTFIESIHPEDQRRVVSKFLQEKENPEVLDEEYRIIRPDNTTRWVWVRTTPIYTNSQITGRAGIAEDITNRKVIENELKYYLHNEKFTNNILTRFINTLHSNIDNEIKSTIKSLTLYLELEYVFFILFQENKDIEYSCLFDITNNNSPYNQFPSSIFRELSWINIRLSELQPLLINNVDVLSSNAKSEIYKLVSTDIKSICAVPLSIDDKLIGVIGSGSLNPDVSLLEQDIQLLRITGNVIINVLVRKQAEDRLTHRSKLVAIGEISAGMAHELNQPITAIILFAQRLLSLSKDDRYSKERFIKTLENILDLSRKTTSIVDELRYFAKTSRRVYADVNLNRVIENALIIISGQLKSDGITLVTQYDSELPIIKGDENQIEQVVINLLNNSRDALNLSEKKVITIETLKRNSEIVLTVSDTGSGINEEIIKDIFLPFYTTKDKTQNMGLGLSICYRIIREHDGEISVKSNHNIGTVFEVSLPIKK